MFATMCIGGSFPCRCHTRRRRPAVSYFSENIVILCKQSAACASARLVGVTSQHQRVKVYLAPARAKGPCRGMPLEEDPHIGAGLGDADDDEILHNANMLVS